MNENRHSERIVRPLNIRFCIAKETLSEWNISSIIGDISAGGIKFLSPIDLKDKVINLEIDSPRFAPRTLKFEALVLDSRPSEYESFFDVRAKFLNLSDSDQQDLSILAQQQRAL